MLIFVLACGSCSRLQAQSLRSRCRDFIWRTICLIRLLGWNVTPVGFEHWYDHVILQYLFQVEHLCFSKQIILLLCSIKIFSTGKTARRFVGHSKDVLSVAFSTDNRQIVSGSRDKTINLWNTLGQLKYTLSEEGRCYINSFHSIFKILLTLYYYYSHQVTVSGSRACGFHPTFSNL